MRTPRRLRDTDCGSAAVEFAVMAPVLVLGVLSTADIGLAIHEAFEIDQALRNGAEAALRDPGESQVEAVLLAVDDAGSGHGLTTWSVDRYHACPETPDARSKEPIRACASNRPSSIFYEMNGIRHHTGILLPSRDLSRTASVQVR